MRMDVNVSFVSAPEALGLLWRAFSIYEFDPRNRFECKNGEVKLTIFFEEKPPIQMMEAISRGKITGAVYGTDDNEEPDDMAIPEPKDEAGETPANEEKAPEPQSENLAEEKGEEPQDESTVVEKDEENQGENAAVVKAEDHTENQKLRPDEQEAEGWDFSSVAKELEGVRTFEGVAELLDLNQKKKEKLVKILEVSCNISGRITWEAIIEQLEAINVSFKEYDKHHISVAVKNRFNLRIINMIKAIVEIVNAEKNGKTEEQAPEPQQEKNEEPQETQTEVAELAEVVKNREPGLECVRGMIENVPQSLEDLEAKLRAISNDDEVDLADRVKTALSYISIGENQLSDKLVNMVVYMLKMPTISFEDRGVVSEFESVTLERVVIASGVKNKMAELGMENIIVKAEEFLTDLRDLIMSDDELEALIE